MPNIKSVVKDVKRSRQRQLRNQAVKSQIKTFTKKAQTAIESADAEATSASMAKAFSVLDKAFKHGIIHKNAAARRKSRLMKRLATSTSSTSETGA